MLLWANQNQTLRHEIVGGFVWSPKRNKNQARNQFYRFMRKVSLCDLIFSYKDTCILAISIAKTYCWECPKPLEFGIARSKWGNIKWKVKVKFTQLTHRIRLKEHIAQLRPFPPAKYSPLQTEGNNLQYVYLASVNEDFAATLIHQIDVEATPLLHAAKFVESVVADDLNFREHQVKQIIEQNTSIPNTERVALKSSRTGQEHLKEHVKQIETNCHITKASNSTHLIANHCKPWHDTTNGERL